MKAKQLIERELKFSDRYIYLDIVRGSIESGQMTYCANCSKLITNMVNIVRSSDKKRLTIGTDCAETLAKANCLYNNGSASDYQVDIYNYNKVARLVTELNAGAKLQSDGMMVHLTDRKGKNMSVFAHDLKKYFPQYLS